MRKILLTSVLIVQCGLVHADRGTEQFVSLFLNQLTKANEHKVPLVEQLKYISPKYLKDAKIKSHLVELDSIPFDYFKILTSFGPYVDYQTDSNGCTGCQRILRVKVEKQNNEYVVIPSGHTASDKYYIQWWWSQINYNYVPPSEIAKYIKNDTP